MHVDLSMVRELLVPLLKRYGMDGSWSPSNLLHESVLVAVLLYKTTYLFFPVEDKVVEMPDMSLYLYSLLILVCFFSLLQEDILSAKPLICLLHSAWGLFICSIAALSVCASLNL